MDYVNDYDNDDAQIMLRLLKDMKFIMMNNITPQCSEQLQYDVRTEHGVLQLYIHCTGAIQRYKYSTNNSNNKH